MPSLDSNDRRSGAGAATLSGSVPDSSSVPIAEAARGPSGQVPRRFLLLLDVVAIAASFLGAHRFVPDAQALVAPGGVLRLQALEWLQLPTIQEVGDFPAVGESAWLLFLMVPAALLGMQVLGGYRPLVWQTRTRVALSCLGSPLLGASVIALTLFAFKQQRMSRLLIFSFVIFTMLAFLGYRSAIRAYKRRRHRAGLYAHNVLLIARPAAVNWLVRHFALTVEPTDYRIAGCLPLWNEPGTIPLDERGSRTPAVQPDQPAVLGSVEDLGDLLIHRPIHDVVAVQSGQDEAWLKKVVEHCDYFRVTLRIVPEVLLSGGLKDLTLLARSPLQLPEIVLRPPHLDSDALFVKRLVDILVSGVLLLVLSPLLAVIALAIRISTPRLPVLYPWRVIGYKGKPFTGYKFTTMVADADERRDELQSKNEMSGPVFKIKDDPRVTTLGRYLRKFSLNELPQLWSVLKGDMSLVGPRPAFPHELQRYELWHKRKLSVQPGITCLWQVSGRNDIRDFDDWVRLDLEYIDNWSLWLDARILLRTAWAVVAGTGS